MIISQSFPLLLKANKKNVIFCISIIILANSFSFSASLKSTYCRRIAQFLHCSIWDPGQFSRARIIHPNPIRGDCCDDRPSLHPCLNLQARPALAFRVNPTYLCSLLIFVEIKVLIFCISRFINLN